VVDLHELSELLSSDARKVNILNDCSLFGSVVAQVNIAELLVRGLCDLLLYVWMGQHCPHFSVDPRFFGPVGLVAVFQVSAHQLDSVCAAHVHLEVDARMAHGVAFASIGENARVCSRESPLNHAQASLLCQLHYSSDFTKVVENFLLNDCLHQFEVRHELSVEQLKGRLDSCCSAFLTSFVDLFNHVRIVSHDSCLLENPKLIEHLPLLHWIAVVVPLLSWLFRFRLF